MMTLDQGGDEGAMLYAQVGHHHLARATETSPERSSGHLSCLSARPHDLADLTVARPKVACVPLSGLPFLYSKRAVAAQSLVSRDRRSNVLSPFWYGRTSRGTTRADGGSPLSSSPPIRGSGGEPPNSTTPYFLHANHAPPARPRPNLRCMDHGMHAGISTLQVQLSNARRKRSTKRVL